MTKNKLYSLIGFKRWFNLLAYCCLLLVFFTYSSLTKFLWYFSGAVELKENDKKFEDLNLLEKPFLTRMKKYWICNICIASSMTTVNQKISQPKLKQVNIKNFNILIPCDTVQTEEIAIKMDSYILIPKNGSALKNTKQ